MIKNKAISRMDAIEELKKYQIKGADVYLIDIIPIIEMIWADGMAQKNEIKIFYNYLKKHVAKINIMAGYTLLTIEKTKKFLKRFMDKRPDPDLMRTLRKLIEPVRLNTSDKKAVNLLKSSLLATCLDIASSSIRQYSDGVKDRFDLDEKRCFFEILETMEKS